MNKLFPSNDMTPKGDTKQYIHPSSQEEEHDYKIQIFLQNNVNF